MSQTGRQIRLEVGRILRQRDEAQFWEYTNTGTATASLTDITTLGSTALTSQQFMNYYVRHSDATAASPDGDKVRARALVNTTGVLSVSPSFAAALANGETGELWKIDPDNVDRARDRALSQLCTRWRLVPLSYALDPDYLVDDLADATPTHWSASSATATITNRSGMERFSERVLRVANSGADGYAGQTINNPSGANTGGETTDWFFFALAQADTGTAQVVVQDLTNAAALDQTAIARTTWAGEAFNVISLTVQAPATCEQVSLRMGGDGASDDTYWGPNCFYPTNATEFVLPSRIFNRSRVGRFFEYQSQDWPEGRFVPLCNQPKILDVGGGQVRVVFDEPIGTRAIFYEEFATYAALQTTYTTAAGRRTGDAASTDCPLEYAAWATLRELVGEDVEEDWQRVHARHGAKTRVRFTRDR